MKHGPFGFNKYLIVLIFIFGLLVILPKVPARISLNNIIGEDYSDAYDWPGSIPDLDFTRWFMPSGYSPISNNYNFINSFSIYSNPFVHSNQYFYSNSFSARSGVYPFCNVYLVPEISYHINMPYTMINPVISVSPPQSDTEEIQNESSDTQTDENTDDNVDDNTENNTDNLQMYCCGSSSYRECESNADCLRDGCNGEICRGIDSTPRFTPCYYKKCFSYCGECRCIEGRCQWTAHPTYSDIRNHRADFDF